MTELLKAALRASRVTYMYLFSGLCRCGKTTSTRVLARYLNCAQSPMNTPCGQCESCHELTAGGPSSLDVAKIDTAPHGGIDGVHDLRERATSAPMHDRYRIFIIGKAHMVTSQGFNVLLKPVEEPSERVKFVFATTESEHVIGTIRSRTHHYPFHLVPLDILGPHLTGPCSGEHIDVSEGVLTLVIRVSGSSVCDALSVFGQLTAGTINDQVIY